MKGDGLDDDDEMAELHKEMIRNGTHFTLILLEKIMKGEIELNDDDLLAELGDMVNY